MLGPVGVGLSVAFALFMLVLFVELYYVWRSRQRRMWAGGLRISANVAAQAPPAMAVKLVQCKLGTWRQMVATCWSAVGAEFEEARGWAKLRLHSVLWLPAQARTTGAGVVEEGKASEGGKKHQEEEDGEKDEEDVFGIGGLWGPPRLLFTIPEETKEEMEVEEEVRSRAGGKGSLRASRASSELLFVPSTCSSPFVTPPSSPPFATPFGSPAPALPLSCKPFNSRVDVESTSSSTSSSSPPLGRRPLSALFEDTSSFSSSSASATPAALSPSTLPLPPSSSPATPNKRQRHPLCLLLDPPPSPSSALYHYHNRVHPLTASASLHRFHIEGNPALSPSRPLSKPSEDPPPPFSSFHLPAPSQPTTPCPFRASLHAKSLGLIISEAPAPASDIPPCRHLI